MKSSNYLEPAAAAWTLWQTKLHPEIFGPELARVLARTLPQTELHSESRQAEYTAQVILDLLCTLVVSEGHRATLIQKNHPHVKVLVPVLRELLSHRNRRIRDSAARILNGVLQE